MPVGSKLLIFRGFVSVAFAVMMVEPAAAQIYSWHDANGNLVLSDRPLQTAEHTFVVPEATSVRATRPAPLERGRLYDDLIEEHARLNSIRSDLVRAVVQVESGFNPSA